MLVQTTEQLHGATADLTSQVEQLVIENEQLKEAMKESNQKRKTNKVPVVQFHTLLPRPSRAGTSLL